MSITSTPQLSTEQQAPASLPMNGAASSISRPAAESTASRDRTDTQVMMWLLAGLLVTSLLGAFWPWWWVATLMLAAAAIVIERRRTSRHEQAQRSMAGAQVASGDLERALRDGGGETLAWGREPAGFEQVIRSGAEAVRLLATRRDTLRDVLDAAGDPILVTDPSGNVVLWNVAAQTFLGRSGDRISGRTLDELFTSADVVAVHASAAAGVRKHVTVRIARESGHRIFEVIASPMDWRASVGTQTQSGTSGRAVSVFLRDITELASASQLQTDFVANASHELRTPLSSIRGATETLIDDSEDPAFRLRLLQMIETNVSRLEELIRDLLDLSRLESKDTGPTIAPVSMQGLIETFNREFDQACAAKKVSLSFDIDPAIQTLYTDGRLLDMILRNLIENSVKFAYEGTTVHVVGKLMDERGKSRGARFMVVDQGLGIPLAGQTRIFERFYQVDPSRQGGTHRRGTGLGLAIVKSAVEALKGTIAVESVWKQGTTMTVELPGVLGQR
jgi:two-component system phosphate regulon sensor histidine kinase PhoR